MAGYGDTAINLQVNVKGGEAVQRRFTTLGDRLRDRIILEVHAAGEEVASAARAIAPKRSGTLARKIDVRDKTTHNRTMIYAVVRSRARYAPFVEFGQKGRDRPVSGYRRKIGSTGVQFPTRSGKLRLRRVSTDIWVKPYMRVFKNKGEPFLGPAFEILRDRITAKIEAAVAAVFSEET